MKRSCLVVVLAGAASLVPSLAAAEHTVQPAGFAGSYDFVTTSPDINDLSFARQVIPPTSSTTNGTSAVLAQSKTIYLNHNGVTLSPGNNDSRTNRSTIASQQTTLGAWNTDAGTWSATVACMRELFQPFNVTVTDVEPPATTNYIEAVFGGSPQQLGLPSNVAGVSPFTTDCSIIENSIVFTFTDVLPNDARQNCEIMAQEIAHSYGLDHELLASDPMTYLNYNGNRSFKDQTAQCGESTARPCGINGNTCRADQNSVALLKERLGTNGTPGDSVAPTVGITSPSNNATVPPGFTVKFDANDNVGVQMATLYIDGNAAGSVLGNETYQFLTSSTLPDGVHKVRVDVTDGVNAQSTEITVTVRVGAAPPGSGNDGDVQSGDLTGGCSTGGGSTGGLLAFGLLGLVGLRRRRR